MKVIRNQNQTTFEKLGTGDVFTSAGRTYMKTESKSLDHESDSNAVTTDGVRVTMQDMENVTHYPNATITLEGKA